MYLRQNISLYVQFYTGEKTVTAHSIARYYNKMFLILLASTLLHLSSGDSLGQSLHISQHGEEFNQRVDYDPITMAADPEEKITRVKRSNFFPCYNNLADR